MAAPPAPTLRQRRLRPLAHQRLSDVRCDSFQEFNRIEGETTFAPIVELNQANNPVLVPNGHQGYGGIAVMHALVAWMKPGIFAGRDVQQRE